eukprot:c39101_g1_i1.p1 GENE.c39101_g1_i1~~c39101_g1_i1.p1  ORF type:complete len:221 (-),score=17.99 c39101_g1_i1:244-906(-)
MTNENLSNFLNFEYNNLNLDTYPTIKFYNCDCEEIITLILNKTNPNNNSNKENFEFSNIDYSNSIDIPDFIKIIGIPYLKLYHSLKKSILLTEITINKLKNSNKIIKNFFPNIIPLFAKDELLLCDNVHNEFNIAIQTLHDKLKEITINTKTTKLKYQKNQITKINTDFIIKIKDKIKNNTNLNQNLNKFLSFADIILSFVKTWFIFHIKNTDDNLNKFY